MRYFESGSVVTQFSLGVERYNGKNKDKSTDWIDCKAWGKTAELIGEKFAKGDYFQAQGNIQQESWEAQDGSKRSKLFINVERVIFTPGKKAGNEEKKAGEATQQDIDAIFASEDEIPF